MILRLGDATLEIEHCIHNKRRNRENIQLIFNKRRNREKTELKLKLKTMDVNPLIVLALCLVVIVMVYR